MVADLDAILTKTISFKLFGKVHKIEPMSVEQFLEFTSAYARIFALREQESVTPQELVEAYGALVLSTGCQSVTKEDIGKMTQQQVAGLFQLMMDLHSGKLFADEKKSLEKMNTLLYGNPNQ